MDFDSPNRKLSRNKKSSIRSDDTIAYIYSELTDTHSFVPVSKKFKNETKEMQLRSDALLSEVNSNESSQRPSLKTGLQSSGPGSILKNSRHESHFPLNFMPNSNGHNCVKVQITEPNGTIRSASMDENNSLIHKNSNSKIQGKRQKHMDPPEPLKEHVEKRYNEKLCVECLLPYYNYACCLMIVIFVMALSGVGVYFLVEYSKRNS